MFQRLLNDHIACFNRLSKLEAKAVHAATLLTNAIKADKKVLVCGNGGSAADAQHFAAELVGRFQKERRAFPAIALTTDTSILSAIANDYGFDDVFSRQIEGLGKAGDVLVAISTSGNSKNVCSAVNKARSMGMITVALVGGSGGALQSNADIAVTVPHTITARIQEAHSFILHCWAEMIEIELSHIP